MDSLAGDSAETRQLLDQLRAGTPGAAGRLLERHRPYLLRLVELRMDPRLRPRVDPSDVVQEAQLEANRRLEGYLEKPPMPFRLWLRQLAYDRLLMLHRRHLRAGRRAVGRDLGLPDRSSLVLAGQLLASEPTASEKAVRRELADRVREAVARLPEAEREVLVLRNLEGLSNLEVAEVLGVDPATSSRRYGRAVLRLRELLVQGGFKGPEG
jgi:RNA polymerase sigma-70 factor (ECF subfamily)